MDKAYLVITDFLRIFTVFWGEGIRNLYGFLTDFLRSFGHTESLRIFYGFFTVFAEKAYGIFTDFLRNFADFHLQTVFLNRFGTFCVVFQCGFSSYMIFHFQ